MNDQFDYTKADSQGTTVIPLSPEKFDIPAYKEYQAVTEEACRAFSENEQNVLVYRRFRVPEVYSWGCRDKKMSLEWQLAALDQSRLYKADVPNFLEPWYGIGVVSSSFGIPYLWKEGQSPAVLPGFTSAKEAINALQCPVHKSPVGQEVMTRIEYFLDKTKGQIPLSLTDTQSPLNIASSYILEASSFMFEMYDHPEDLKELMSLISELEMEFLQKQMDLIGDALVKPGHGFASSRFFSGIGFSDDNILMIGDEAYNEFALPYLCRAASIAEGPVFHSCGDWAGRAEFIKTIPGLIMVDGALGAQTDPSPNDGAVLGHAFAGESVILHVRIVGNSETVLEVFEKMAQPGLKTIVTTYCETPEDQDSAYRGIHALSQG
ncbi:hypothetical protein EXM22_16935 [Oceanispirochaeta crateris]|uniref:Uroporphyrinogen decarboxylase (URO-D) domain-containing protein n=1 Tax=Oceanispirochaeta crateris TaxID=2518645 RepID=A0A5C1QNP6_9SPIO|nr:uroporphyrinogen decarboxylase family protein [Oceanispirochaeta crateris]QEN09583.1 hypothetical protein EXM22_16935 [Oceanispirochaeta crateris]